MSERARLLELAAADQADRRAPPTSELGRRDRERRLEVHRLLSEAADLGAEDLTAAALVLQHSDDVDEIDEAHELACRALIMGHESAGELVAMTADRAAMYRGWLQPYGTQVVPTATGWRLWDVDPETSDDDRADLGLLPLAQLRATGLAAAGSVPLPPPSVDLPLWLSAARDRWRLGGEAGRPRGELGPEPPGPVRSRFGVIVERLLGGRASKNWLVRRGDRPMVLRGHVPAPWQTPIQLPAAVEWRGSVTRQLRERGWPTARPVHATIFSGGAWWSLEEYLPGTPRPLAPANHARLLADFHASGEGVVEIGPQPGHLDHLAVLADETADGLIDACADPDDRRWLRRRLVQARSLAATIDWSASPAVLVHGDFVQHNLLFESSQLTGLLDLELATVDRRILDLQLVWRCRHDDVLLAYDRLVPLTADEWRMLLVDWWAAMVKLAVVQLRAGRQPDRWELDGLRRTSELSTRLEQDFGPL